MDSFDGFQIHVPEYHLPEIPDQPQWYMWADTQFEIIKEYVQEFEKSLDKEHEVGLLLTNFGQSVLMEVETIGYEKSVILVFKGKVNGNQATLIQHMNQLNFLLTALPKTEPEKPKRKIGFITPSEEDTED